MVNKEIARHFNLLANLMELHGENAFKTKAYANAFLALRKWDVQIDGSPEEEIAKIPGIGSSVASKIKELLSTGKIDALEKLREKTPEGIQQLLAVKGLGPKKIRVIWDELKVESPAELLYACNENRLVKLTGFGLKTQEDLKQRITYFLDSQSSYLYANIEEDMHLLLEIVRKTLPGFRVEWAGEFATYAPVINQIKCVVSPVITPEKLSSIDKLVTADAGVDGSFDAIYDDRLSFKVYTCPESDFVSQWCSLTWDQDLLKKIGPSGALSGAKETQQVLADYGYKDLPIELVDKKGIVNSTAEYWEGLVKYTDLKGILHNHSTWSDGINTLEEMAIHVKKEGYQYFAICDHSRSAFYANGLSAERVIQQMEEIDRLNATLGPFKVFKGIESDILGDGSLDYEPDILEKFDLVVASIHSNLRMEEAKATARLIKAIENPYTRILGHPTSRLLLARKGYPIDHRKVIDACAANRVAIELNANPLRLDIDYEWLDYCMEKKVWVSINPDAHSRSQVGYIKYGVYAARKGGLKVQYCLNALPLDQFNTWLEKR